MVRAPGPTLGQATVLGLLQGPAELVPVSSSAHLALAPWFLGWDWRAVDPEIRKALEVALHAGTALALAGARHRSPRDALARAGPHTALWVAGTLGPPALAGLALERPIERRLGTPAATAAGLAAGAAALVASDRSAGRRRASQAGPADALALGAAQAVALLPGISRAGATVAAARARGFEPPAAYALSRRAALPVIAAATALKGARLARRPPPARTRAAMAIGAVAAGAAAILTERGLDRRGGELPAAGVAAYRLALAVLVLRRLRHNGRR